MLGGCGGSAANEMLVIESQVFVFKILSLKPRLIILNAGASAQFDCHNFRHTDMILYG